MDVPLSTEAGALTADARLLLGPRAAEVAVRDSLLRPPSSATTLTPSPAPPGGGLVHRPRRDSLWGIGARFNIGAWSVMWSNGLEEDSIILPGQRLRIPPVQGVVHTVGAEDSLDSSPSDTPSTRPGSWTSMASSRAGAAAGASAGGARGLPPGGAAPGGPAGGAPGGGARSPQPAYPPPHAPPQQTRPQAPAQPQRPAARTGPRAAPRPHDRRPPPLRGACPGPRGASSPPTSPAGTPESTSPPSAPTSARGRGHGGLLRLEQLGLRLPGGDRPRQRLQHHLQPPLGDLRALRPGGGQGAAGGPDGQHRRSTGPHLHFEILRGGSYVNPLGSLG